MPELPEVGTIGRHLAPRVEGAVLERLVISDARWCEPAPPHDLHDATAGRTIERLARRGKYLVWELEGDVHLVMHLRMTGNLLLAAEGAGDPPYVRARLELSSGERVLFAD